MGENQRKETKLINENNTRENAKHIKYDYQIGDEIMLKTECKTKYGEDQHEGPYAIVKVNNNGTVRFKKKSVIDVFNIRNVHPYKE